MSTELIGRWIDHRIIRAGPEAPRRQLCLVRPWADEVVSSYTITFAAFILTAGALGDRIGAKRIFMAGSPSSPWHGSPARWHPPRLFCWRPGRCRDWAPLALFRTRRHCSATLIR
jgi:hypothetical protein